MRDFEEAIRDRMGEDDAWKVVVDEIHALDTVVPIPEAGSEVGDSVLVDVQLDVRGVDEMSSSRIALRKKDGRLKHGALRAGEVDLGEQITLSELESRWEGMVRDSGVDIESDNVALQMRQVGRDQYVPHLVFGNDGGVNPIPISRLLRVIETLPRLWNERTQDLDLRGRISRTNFEGQEQTTGTVDDMLGNL